MFPFGIDFGNSSTVVSCFRNGAVHVVPNEVSHRATPTLVGFGSEIRQIGENAKAQQMFNLTNTAGNLKRLLGSEPEELKIVRGEDNWMECYSGGDDIDVHFNYRSKVRIFSATQLCAMYFNKLKTNALKETGSPMTQVCISVPMWYTQKQRTAILNACIIADIRGVRLVNELTAAAVGYTAFNVAEFPNGNQPKIVAFIDLGHTSYQVAIAAIRKDKVDILGCAYDKNLGGRDFDHEIVEYIKSLHPESDFSDVKFLFRALKSAEKLKKLLSANNSTNTTIEASDGSKDLYIVMERKDFEELIVSKVLQGSRLENPIVQALSMAGLKREQVQSIEVIGGSARIPYIRKKLTEFFGKPLSSTLNQDEAITTGNTYIAGMSSRKQQITIVDGPFTDVSFQSRKQEFASIKAISDHDIKPVADLKQMDIDNEHKVIEAKQHNVSFCEWTTPEYIGTIRLQFNINESGLYTVEVCPSFEKPDVFEMIPSTFELTNLKELKNIEKKLILEDESVLENENMKNALEEYIYDFREKLDGVYQNWVDENEKQELLSLLSLKENWLCDEGSNKSKEVYEKEYGQLAIRGDKIRNKHLIYEHNRRKSYLEKVAASMNGRDRTVV
ncbi:heat shock protein 70 [Scheffersomyces coipomensis]|uniref:heat shock protein 70 n=1 Tax=Scheffersomyces coipomensis TaxID=1788519 RepID=UPI00315DBFC0